FRILEVNGPGVLDVTLAGLTIGGGNTAGNASGATGTGTANDGAGILLFDENLTLDGVAVTGNTSGSEGGGIAVASAGLGGAGFLTVRNSTISGNFANGTPPQLGSFGGAG